VLRAGPVKLGRQDLSRYTAPMIHLTVLVATVLLAAPLAAVAQWQWIDGSGRRVFSDQPPPPAVPQKNILRQPGRAPVPQESAESPPPSATAAPAAAPRPTRDPELEKRRAQAEAAEAEKKKAEEERIARLRSENCTRARQAKATLDSGIRLARVNEKGDREILDDAARAGELRRLDEIIATDCKS
jgi:type IV secretory pathway VirB10-like protein